MTRIWLLSSVLLFMFESGFCQSERYPIVNYSLNQLPVTGHFSMRLVDSFPKLRYFVPDFTLNVSTNDSLVYSLRQGLVSCVFSINDDFIVIVRSNEFFLVYSNIDKLLVQEGQLVDSTIAIGQLFHKEDIFQFGLQVFIKDNSMSSHPIWGEKLVQYLHAVRE